LGDREGLARHLAQSVKAFRAAALATPLEVAVLEPLSRVYHWQKNYEGLYATFSILSYLDAADAAARSFLLEAMARRGPEATRPLSLYDAQITPADAQGAARPLWQAVADLLLRVDARDPALA